MILQQIQQHLIANPGCSLANLAKHFRLSEDAALSMLQPWIKRDRIKLQTVETCSGSCGCGIEPEQTVLYWLDADQIGFRLQ